MVFSSGVFLFFFLPLFYAVYLLLPLRWRIGSFFLFSLLFYAYGEGVNCLLLIGCGFGNYWLAKRMAPESKQHVRKWWLMLAIVANLLLLGWYKYADFTIGNLNALWNYLGGDGALPLPRILLPLGISFFVFQGMSYVIDVYRRDAKAGTALQTMTYLALFPQLVAGPIVRYQDVEERLLRPARLMPLHVTQGLQRFILGLAKKVLLADGLAFIADFAFTLPLEERTFAIAWVGAIAYMLQIYFDFSGYSDMAIGLGRTLGFEFPENFTYPYLATSIRDFWRRWHRSLSTWFRDYVYIPLGGNRSSPMRTYVNLGIVFFLTGLWHGANWAFVAWGLWHGLWIVFERILGPRFDALPSVFRRVLVLLIILVGWVLFRAESFTLAWQYLASMAGAYECKMGFGELSCSWGFIVLFALALLACYDWRSLWTKIPERYHLPLLTVATLLLFLLILGRIGVASHTPFLYFRF